MSSTDCVLVSDGRPEIDSEQSCISALVYMHAAGRQRLQAQLC